MPIKPSYCVIEKLNLNKDRKKLLDKRQLLKDKAKGKYTEKNMTTVS